MPGCVIMLACNSGFIAARSTAARNYGICVRACAHPFRFLSFALFSFVPAVFSFTFPFVLSLPVVISLRSRFVCAFIFLFTSFLVSL